MYQNQKHSLSELSVLKRKWNKCLDRSSNSKLVFYFSWEIKYTDFYIPCRICWQQYEPLSVWIYQTLPPSQGFVLSHESSRRHSYTSSFHCNGWRSIFFFSPFWSPSNKIDGLIYPLVGVLPPLADIISIVLYISYTFVRLSSGQINAPAAERRHWAAYYICAVGLGSSVPSGLFSVHEYCVTG